MGRHAKAIGLQPEQRQVAHKFILTRRVTPEDIVHAVECVTAVSIQRIRSKSRMPDVIRARWALIWLLSELTILSGPDIAEIVRGRRSSHATVFDAMGKIRKWNTKSKQGRNRPGVDPQWPGLRERYHEIYQRLMPREYTNLRGTAKEVVTTAGFAEGWLRDMLHMDDRGAIHIIDEATTADRIAACRAAVIAPIVTASGIPADDPNGIGPRVGSALVAEEKAY